MGMVGSVPCDLSYLSWSAHLGMEWTVSVVERTHGYGGVSPLRLAVSVMERTHGYWGVIYLWLAVSVMEGTHGYGWVTCDSQYLSWSAHVGVEGSVTCDSPYLSWSAHMGVVESVTSDSPSLSWSAHMGMGGSVTCDSPYQSGKFIWIAKITFSKHNFSLKSLLHFVSLITKCYSSFANEQKKWIKLVECMHSIAYVSLLQDLWMGIYSRYSTGSFGINLVPQGVNISSKNYSKQLPMCTLYTYRNYFIENLNQYRNDNNIDNKWQRNEMLTQWKYSYLPYNG